MAGRYDKVIKGLGVRVSRETQDWGVKLQVYIHAKTVERLGVSIMSSLG